MNNILWAQILVLMSHTFVVLCLILHAIRLFDMILIYYNPELFFAHLLKKPDDYLLELIDLAKFAAKKENTSLYNSCIQHVYELLSKNRL